MTTRSRALVATGMLVLASTWAAPRASADDGAKKSAEERAQARAFYEKGTRAYDLGNYDEAAEHYKKAYEVKDDPVLLYNIAQAYRLGNKYAEAERFYRTYLRKDPRARNRDEVEKKIADMEKMLEQQRRVTSAAPMDTFAPGTRPGASGEKHPSHPGRDESSSTANSVAEPTAVASSSAPPPAETMPPEASAPSATPAREPVVLTPEPAPAPSPRRPGLALIAAGAVVAVVGLGALAGGIAVGTLAKSASDQQMASPVYNPDLDSRGALYNTLTEVLIPVGGVLVAGGVVMAVVGALKRPAPERSPSAALSPELLPSVGPGHAGATLRLRF